LHVVARSDRYDSSTYTDVPIVDVSATYDAEAGRAALFLVNRSLDEAADLTADLSRIGASAVINATTLHARGQQDRHATNLNDHAAVIPHAFRTYALAEGILQADLPPLLWTVLELNVARGAARRR
jgi:alpha-N-arabinofuranosidase